MTGLPCSQVIPLESSPVGISMALNHLSECVCVCVCVCVCRCVCVFTFKCYLTINGSGYDSHTLHTPAHTRAHTRAHTHTHTHTHTRTRTRTHTLHKKPSKVGQSCL